MTRIIDRYLLLEVLKVFIAILGTLILVVGSLLLLRILEDVNLGALNADILLRYLALEIVSDAPSLMPPAFFLAVLVAFGRLSRDSEMIALFAGGVGPWRLYRPLLYAALPLAVLTAWFALDLKPSAVKEIQVIRAQQKDEGNQIAGLHAGRFYQQFNGGLTLYIGEIDERRRLRHVFIHDRRGAVERLVVSNEGFHRLDEATGDHLITLLDGRRYDGNPGSGDYGIGTFASYQIWLEARTTAPPGNKRSGRPTRAIYGSVDPADKAEWQSRLAGPLAIFTLGLIAVPLSITSPRQRGTGQLLLAFITYFSFFNLQRLAEAWLQRGITPVWLGSLWYQFLILAIVAIILLSDSYWIKRLRRRIGLG